MTSTTITIVPSACIQHGLLEGGGRHRDCPRCGRQAYQLDDDGDRATLRVSRRAALQARVRTFAIAGYVGFVTVQSVGAFVLGLGMGIDVVSAPAAVAAGLGAACAWFVRRPSQHRLDSLL